MREKVIHSFIAEINKSDTTLEIKKQFLSQVEKGNLSLEENPETHFTVSFVAYDLQKRLVFSGLHKRSGLWMFNGGHVERDEPLKGALRREMKEEWGSNSFLETENKPSLLTKTPVISPGDRECKLHYGIWYFIPVDSINFNPDPEILEEEYTETGWKTIEEARKLIIVPNYLLVLDEIANIV